MLKISTSQIGFLGVAMKTLARELGHDWVDPDRPGLDGLAFEKPCFLEMFDESLRINRMFIFSNRNYNGELFGVLESLLF